MNISELGVFPHWKAPRVVWLALDQPNELMMLQRSLDASINALGFEPERKPFSPHLTIGRIQNHLSRDEISLIGKLLREQAVSPIGAVACDTICLFQSLLKPTGSIYAPLSAEKLRFFGNCRGSPQIWGCKKRVK
jgi:2'-5' RNA ligase